MKTIFLVMAQAGDYEEHDRWPVCAFSRRRDAEERVDLCRAEAARLRAKYQKDYEKWGESDGSLPLPKIGRNKLDPSYAEHHDYGRADYYCVELAHVHPMDTSSEPVQEK